MSSGLSREQFFSVSILVIAKTSHSKAYEHTKKAFSEPPKGWRLVFRLFKAVFLIFNATSIKLQSAIRLNICSLYYSISGVCSGQISTDIQRDF